MLVQFAFGAIEVDETDDEEISPENACENCGDETIVPDDRTGLIHAHGRYGCYTLVGTKKEWLGTVAE